MKIKPTTAVVLLTVLVVVEFLAFLWAYYLAHH